MAAPIHHTFGPHVDRAYLHRTLGRSYLVWRYRHGPDIARLQTEIEQHFPGYGAALFRTGREAFLAWLQSLGLQRGDEVILPGYTCVVLPNAVHATGAKAVYADIDPHTLNVTVASVRDRLTPRTRVVLLQHTFGMPGPAAELRTLCDERGILLVEDLAHVLPDAKSPFYGRHGHACLLSFGRDKAISGISGGAILTQHATLSQTLHVRSLHAPLPRFREIVRTLEYPTRMHNIVRPLSGTPLLKPAVWLLNAIGLFSPVLTEVERNGGMDVNAHALPNVYASLARASLQDLPRLNTHRRMLTERYLVAAREYGWTTLPHIDGDLPLQKFPLFHPRADELRQRLLRDNIHLDDGWTGCTVCPRTVRRSATGYHTGDAPGGETVSQGILSLPTHPTTTLAQAERLISILARIW